MDFLVQNVSFKENGDTPDLTIQHLLAVFSFQVFVTKRKISIRVFENKKRVIKKTIPRKAGYI